jgi:hypothetical protein
MGSHIGLDISAFSALTFGPVALPLMLAHIVVLVWFAWRRREIMPVLALNLLVSGGAMVYWATRFDALIHDVDTVWAVVAFEIVVLATSLAALSKTRVPRTVILAEFALQMTLIAAAIVFMATFKITRLT